MGIHKDDAGRQEKHQLNQGVVYHMEQRPVYCQGIFLSQKSLHPHAHQDKPDLGHGGAGQRPFQIHGKNSQQRAAEHGQHAHAQNQRAPRSVVKKQLARHHQDAEDSCFRQDTG